MLELISVVILTVTTFVSTPYRYYQSYKLREVANSLSTQNYNQQALKKFEEAQKIWNDKEVNNKIQEIKDTIENEKYYQQGSRAIDDKKWDEAIIALSKVRKTFKNFDSAQSLLNFARDKTNQEKNKNKEEEVKGITSEPENTIYTEKIITPTLSIFNPDISTSTQDYVEIQIPTKNNVYPTITNTPFPTPDLRPKDSYGNLCSSYLSHCKYECTIKDSDVDYRINTISMHNNQLDICKKNSNDCSIWENALKTDFASLINYCGSDFLNHL